MSIAMGVGGTSLAYPYLLKWIVTDDWRNSFWVMSLTLLSILVVYAMLVANKPERYNFPSSDFTRKLFPLFAPTHTSSQIWHDS